MDREKEKTALRDSRHKSLLELLEETGDTHERLAERVSTAANYVSQMARKERPISSAMASRIETEYRKPARWMDRHVVPVKPAKNPIAQQNFLAEDLAVLKQLTSLPRPRPARSHESA